MLLVATNDKKEIEYDVITIYRSFYVAVFMVKELLRRYEAQITGSPLTVGVISPYKAQVAVLKEKFRAADLLPPATRPRTSDRPPPGCGPAPRPRTRRTSTARPSRLQQFRERPCLQSNYKSE